MYSYIFFLEKLTILSFNLINVIYETLSFVIFLSNKKIEYLGEIRGD